MRTLNRRWYDEDSAVAATFERLKGLDCETKKVLSENLIEIIRQIKDLHREEADPNLSLGIRRVIGLYHQTTTARRWYDENDEIAYALKTLSTLPSEDFFNIVEGLSVSLQD